MSKGWDAVNLEKVIKHRKEFIGIDDFKKYKRCRVKLHAQGIELRDIVQGAEIKTKKQQICKTDDLLVAEIDAKIGGFGIVPENLDGAIVSSHYFLFEINESLLDIKFLDYFIRTPAFRDQVSAQGSTNYAAIRPNDVLGYTIPLPLLEEQRRIVARIEELVGKIEEVRSLRQQALEETDILTKSALLSIVNNFGEKYNYRQLNELILDAGYGTSVKCEYGRINNSVPVLRIPNVASEEINFNDIKYGLLTNTDLQRVLVTEGDILVVRTNGSAELVGRCAVVPTLPEATAFASYLIRLHCDRQQIDPYFLQLMLRHLRSAGQLFDFARTSAGQYNVSLGRLRAAKIPVPPLCEQRRTVAYLNEFQTKVDTMKRLKEEAIKELDALLPSILDKAFKGEI
ncbi:restriction endonuclease subunit S [Nostoc sp. FACHB-190]|uniref:restriction endonuclease subunit S n=1 Tax=Nostoc sp. FACHB-190 TaxID=2692838 RepID=UPI001687B155|nr:restriction endonuclease subunit S [Nostoc sp. FACHB-190]MBD2300010.1 restriction endonuclease subunit S [Nostoc sp. FACHB-190]